MIFNSGAFALLLTLTFIVWHLIPKACIQARNLLIIGVSYLFYGWWDWRFLGLILISTSVDYAIGLRMGSLAEKQRRRPLLYLSLAVNLGILGFFKYFDFFSVSFAQMMKGFGLAVHPVTLGLILPVGISFYTFQTLSYTIDVYRGHLKPTKNAAAFFAFVSFFPQLVAGPIERARDLLPQFQSPRDFDPEKAADGMRQFLWGLFKKVVVADNVALQVDLIHAGHAQMGAADLALGAFYFAVQIYCDFSGYSDMAIGMARLFGINLKDNFKYPFFSRDLTEYKRKWHISLYTWFRDYLFVPLMLRRKPAPKWYLVSVAMFNALLIGLWHGADYKFISWTLLHASVLIPTMLAEKRPKHKHIVAKDRLLPNLRETLSMARVLMWVSLVGVFFRGDTFAHAFHYLTRMATLADLGLPRFKFGLVLAAVLLGWEWLQRGRRHGLEVSHLPKLQRWTLYYVVVLMILVLGRTDYVPYIYFQF